MCISKIYIMFGVCVYQIAYATKLCKLMGLGIPATGCPRWRRLERKSIARIRISAPRRRSRTRHVANAIEDRLVIHAR
jgi:hypothetical protein